jgi:hypothetical protein
MYRLPDESGLHVISNSEKYFFKVAPDSGNAIEPKTPQGVYLSLLYFSMRTLDKFSEKLF